METNQGDGKATWPKNRRRRKGRPAPISIIQGNDKFFIKQEVLSPTPIDDSLPISPRTPVLRYNPLMKTACVPINHLPPIPPPHTKQQLLPAALELPGSLLLPSQGFPQSDPPCTPARRLPCLSRSSSEESDQTWTDQIWTPASAFSSTTEIEDDEMPRPFPPMHLPRVAKASKLRDCEAPVTPELGVGKPISSMSAEELLSELPQLDANTVKSVWVPAMLKQHERIKKLLQDACNVRFDASIEIHDFDQVRLTSILDFFNAKDPAQTLESLSRHAHKISHSYEKAVKSAESLVERDAKACRDRLETTQNNLQAALSTIDNNQQILRQKDDTIQQLRYTVDDIVRVLGDFIRDHTPYSVMQNVHQDDVHDVMQMLTDYGNTPTNNDEATGRFMRVPEEHYMASIDALREAQLKTERFREVAVNQDQLITQQSKQLDSKLAAYEKSMGVIAERNHEVRLLADDNKQLRKMIEEFETGLRVSSSTRAVQDELFKEQEAMQAMLTNMQLSHALDLKDKDAVIADLEMKLGTANAEVLRGKADVKNVITHTQALLSPVELANDFSHSNLNERRLISRGKGKPTGLPTSQSMLFFNQHDQNSEGPKIPERRQSANLRAKPVQQPTVAMMPRDVTSQWACGVSQKQSGQDLRDLGNFSPNYAPRPREDPLGCGNSQQVGSKHQTKDSVGVGRMLGTPIKFDPNKRLPNRPEPHYAHDLYTGENAASMDQEDWNQQQGPQQSQYVPSPPIIQRKRVLSLITERSGEDSVSASEKASEKDNTSTASLAREKHRNELPATRDLEHPQQTGKSNAKGKEEERVNVPDYEGSDYYAPLHESQMLKGDAVVARSVEASHSGKKMSPQQAKVYATSQNSSNSTPTRKSQALNGVEGIRVMGDPWLSGSPARI